MSAFKAKLAKHLDVNGDDSQRWKPICKVFWIKYYFLIGLIFVLILGGCVPKFGSKSGPLATSITSSWIAVCVKSYFISLYFQYHKSIIAICHS